MALGAALKDRARIVEQTPLPLRVEGKTVATPTTGAWFRARLELPAGSEDRSTGRRRVVTSPTLMYGIRDEQGQAILLNSSSRVEVDSPQLGRAVWEITADPAPMRKKSSVIGYTVSIQRVVDHDFDPRLP